MTAEEKREYAKNPTAINTLKIAFESELKEMKEELLAATTPNVENTDSKNKTLKK